MFIDIMYPDNGNRKTRIEEIGTDMGLYIFQASKDKLEIDAALTTANEVIANVYRTYAKTPVTMRDIETPSGTPVAVCDIIFGVLGTALGYVAYKFACKFFLLRIGGTKAAEILAEKGLTQLIKLNVPVWGRILGSAGAEIVVLIVVESIVDSIIGAVQRDQMQKFLREISPERVAVKKICSVNAVTKLGLDTVINSYNTIVKVLPPALITKEMLDNIAKNVLAEDTLDLSKITDRSVRAELALLDSSRKSWTKEDGLPPLLQNTDVLPAAGPDLAEGLTEKQRITLKTRKILSSLPGLTPDQRMHIDNACTVN